ncbi:MAG TPA: HlyD family secretion protein [Terriglobales bacterium]|jgi:membrane fusion protein (multidrug efflux system)|nr:HlyD family secretion protein [Terriglobales bacterium]
MEPSNSVVAEGKPQADVRPPQSSSPQPPPPPPPDSESRYQRRSELLSHPRTRMGLIFVGLLILIGVFFLWRYLASYEATDDAQVDGHVNSVSARVSGHVVSLNVQDNQYVEKGTVLVEIDPSDYEVAVAQARAEYADAEAQASVAGINVPITNVNTSSQVSGAQAGVSGAQAGIAAARQQLDAAKAQIAEADANNTKAQNDLVRYKLLIDKQEISQQQYDQAVASAQAAAATLKAARANADAYAAQIEQAQSKLQQANADLRNAGTAPQTMRAMHARAESAQAFANQKKAALDQAELNLQYTKVIAPVSGAVSNRTVEVGQNVQPGQEMMKVIPLGEGDLWVTANFKETQLKKMKPGLPADISVDATGKTYKGHVDSIAGASGARFSLLPPENATGNYVKVVQRIPVKIVFDRDETKGHELRPGMSVVPKVWIDK